MATFGLIRNFYTTENKMWESSIRVAPIFVNESDETFHKCSRCGFVTRFSSPGVYGWVRDPVRCRWGAAQRWYCTVKSVTSFFFFFDFFVINSLFFSLFFIGTIRKIEGKERFLNRGCNAAGSLLTPRRHSMTGPGVALSQNPLIIRSLYGATASWLAPVF